MPICSAICAAVNWPLAANWSITLLVSLGVLGGGATWNWPYLRYRSIWPGYVSHASADLAIFIVGCRLIFGPG